MEVTKTKPEDYIKSLDTEDQDVLSTLDKMISKIFKGEPRVMWEGVFWGGSEQRIIGYGEWNYVNSKKEEVKWHVIGLSRQKNYFTLNVNAFDGNTQLLPKYEGKLGKVKASKASMNFKKLEDLNLETLEAMLKEAKELST